MKKQILLVEDDSFITQMYVSKLEESGAEIHVYANPLEAQEELQKPSVDYDLLLYDLMLPDMSGYDLIRWTKEQDHLKEIPIIVLSNLSAQKDVDDAYDAGAVDFIVKSNYTPNEVLRVINRHVSLK